MLFKVNRIFKMDHQNKVVILYDANNKNKNIVQIMTKKNNSPKTFERWSVHVV